MVLEKIGDGAMDGRGGGVGGWRVELRMVTGGISPWAVKVVAHEVEVREEGGSEGKVDVLKKPGACWKRGRDDVVVVREGVASCVEEGYIISALKGCRRMLPVNYTERKQH